MVSAADKVHDDLGISEPLRSVPADLRIVAEAETEAPNSVLGKVALILQAFTIDDDALTLSQLSRVSPMGLVCLNWPRKVPEDDTTSSVLYVILEFLLAGSSRRNNGKSLALRLTLGPPGVPEGRASKLLAVAAPACLVPESS